MNNETLLETVERCRHDFKRRNPKDELIVIEATEGTFKALSNECLPSTFIEPIGLPDTILGMKVLINPELAPGQFKFISKEEYETNRVRVLCFCGTLHRCPIHQPHEEENPKLKEAHDREVRQSLHLKNDQSLEEIVDRLGLRASDLLEADEEVRSMRPMTVHDLICGLKALPLDMEIVFVQRTQMGDRELDFDELDVKREVRITPRQGDSYGATIERTNERCRMVLN